MLLEIFFNGLIYFISYTLQILLDSYLTLQPEKRILSTDLMKTFLILKIIQSNVEKQLGLFLSLVDI